MTVWCHTVMTATDLPSSSAQHELEAPPWSRVESTILAAAADIRALYDQRFEPLELTLSLASLLCYLDDFGPVTQTRAADHLRQGRAVTGTQVDRLERRGLVERLPDPADRRVWLVALTDAGRILAASAVEIDVAIRGELRDGVSRSERQALASVLVRLQHNISAALEQGGEAETHPPNTQGEPS